MYGLSGLLLVIVGLWIKTDNTAYQALVLVWLWCGNTGKYSTCEKLKNKHMVTQLILIYHASPIILFALCHINPNHIYHSDPNCSSSTLAAWPKIAYPWQIQNIVPHFSTNIYEMPFSYSTLFFADIF